MKEKRKSKQHKNRADRRSPIWMTSNLLKAITKPKRISFNQHQQPEIQKRNEENPLLQLNLYNKNL